MPHSQIINVPIDLLQSVRFDTTEMDMLALAYGVKVTHPGYNGLQMMAYKALCRERGDIRISEIERELRRALLLSKTTAASLASGNCRSELPLRKRFVHVIFNHKKRRGAFVSKHGRVLSQSELHEIYD